MKEFSTYWKSSKNPKKQRKYRFTAPLHLRHKFVSAHLSEELIKKYKKRSLPLKKGDKVKVMRGQHKKKEGKIARVHLGRIKVFIEGIEKTRKDGTKSLLPFHPSNLLITELNLEDKKRKEKLAGKTEKPSEKAAKEKK